MNGPQTLLGPSRQDGDILGLPVFTPCQFYTERATCPKGAESPAKMEPGPNGKLPPHLLPQ